MSEEKGTDPAGTGAEDARAMRGAAPADPARKAGAREQRMIQENARLHEAYPHVECPLVFHTPFELLVATVLSAQTTDRRVNSVTPALFAAWGTPRDLAAARPADVEATIRPVGLYHAKAQHIIALSAALDEQYAGQVPRTMEQLTALPGVGRKTANVVLGNAFGIPGFPVDTHVIRVTGRLRWHDEWRAAHPSPERIEKAVTAVFPPAEWTDLSHRLIRLGRDTCHARGPRCAQCPLAATCPSASA